jgi:hypothetical protein
MKTTAPAPKAQTQPAPAPAGKPQGLSPQQKQAYAQKLVGADLKLETSRANALKKEAAAVQGFNPAKAQQLSAVGDDRLGLIHAEQSQRNALAQTRLSNGQSGAELAQAVTRLNAGQLAQQLAAAKSGPDAPVRTLVLTRETERRASRAQAAAQSQEANRLDEVKQSYEQQLHGLTPGALVTEQKAEHGRLAQAQTALDAASAELAQAATPEDRAAAQALVTTAAKNVRTEYAKSAVVDADAPVQVNHQALHDYANTLKGFSMPQLQAERKKVGAEFAQMQAHPGLVSRSALRTDQIKVAIIDAAIARAQGHAPGPVGGVKPVDKTRNPGNVVFNGPGMFVANASAYPPSLYAAKLKAAGVTWVTLQVNNPGPVGDNLTSLQNGWADQWRAAGFKVGFWGVSYGNADTDARTAAQLTAQYKGDFYIADNEGPFQAGEGDRARNAQFVNAFQDEANKLGIGKIPRALSSMGRVALDMKPWIDDGWDAMPQAYWNDHNVYQPSACVKFYEDSGWPKDRIHPTIATYTPTGDASPKQIKDYVDDLKAGGTTGISYYLPESYLDDDEYQQLVDGLRNGMNGPA